MSDTVLSLLRYHIDHREMLMKGTQHKIKSIFSQADHGTNKWRHFEMQSGQSVSQSVSQCVLPSSRVHRGLDNVSPHVVF